MSKINRREFLAATSAVGYQDARPSRPNILHIQSDQQQWATLAGRSECRTPNLDRLGREGMQFERSYTPSAVCCPSRAMTMSGAYHWHNGVYNQVHSAPSLNRDLKSDVVLYSQRLRDAGYRLGYTGKWHSSWMRTPTDFGYEMANVAGCDPAALRKHDQNPDRVERPNERLKVTAVREFQWPGSKPFTMWGYREGPEEATPEAYLTECGIRMMKRYAKQAQPWHLEVQYVQPHDPYLPLKKYLDRYDPRSIAVSPSFKDRFEGKPGLHRRESGIWGAFNEDDYRAGRAHYYAYTEQLDAQIGRLLAALDETGQAGNTLVVFTSDHGDTVGAHRMWIKGWMPYEECYRVPMIARWPGRIAPGSRCEHLVQLQDLAHTYAEVGGAKPMPFADGRSLVPLFEDAARSDWADDILCAYYGGEFLYTQRIAINRRYKYVFNGFDFDELYDLEKDPHELRNAVDDPSYRPVAADMQARLYDMMNRFDDPYGDRGVQGSPGQRPDRYGAARYLPRGARS
ncbi:MAG TPA: sulfatase-like hydrolase/transferase [Bryobacteraceae bacterium]|nr:sulfatase-like hydrolase/transferase [Bryobacteraceae bacterium]